MSFPIMPFMKKVQGGAVPIMSFQTNKNGTFSPVFIITSGVLKWIIDGEQIISNSPTKALIGDTVDVEVFANTVPLGEEVTNINLQSNNIIGTLDLLWCTLNGIYSSNFNSGLNVLNFSEFNNIISSFADIVASIDDLDFTNVTLTGVVLANQSGLKSIEFGDNNHTISSLRVDLNGGLTGNLDLKNATVVGIFRHGTTSISNMDFGTKVHTISEYQGNACPLLESVDAGNTIFTSTIQMNGCLTLDAFTGGSYASTISDIDLNFCSLDLTSVDGLFAKLNTDLTASPPVNDCTVNVAAGTNASPTGGASNTDLVNLRDVVYPNAGFTFTAIIN